MKKFSLLVAICIFMTIMSPCAFADSSAEMTAAVTLVKERVEIPESCTEFWGNMSLYGNAKKWDFRWETPESAETAESVSVTMRENGIIESVYSYTFSDKQISRAGKTLPKISEEQAIAIAVNYGKKINPDICAEYMVGAKAAWWGDSYSVTIPRTVGGITVYNNSVSVQVNGLNGKTENYSLSHNDEAVFHPVEGVISAEEAKNAYMRHGYLKKEYRIFEDKAVLVYTPGNAGNLMDAASGESYAPEYDENFRGSVNEVMKEDMAVSGTAAPTLTPQERKAVEEAAGLISYDKATEIIKGVPQFYMPDEMEPEAGNTYKTENGRYIIRVSLKNRDEESYARVYGELDGVTGEILYFNASDKRNTEEKADAEKAMAVYATFADTYVSAYKENLTVKEAEASDYAIYIRAERTENGIPVYGNGISVTVEPGGKITHYALTWNQLVTFSSAENSISEEAAYGVLYHSASPELYYYAIGEKADPIYAMGQYDFSFIAATDGARLSYSGNPYVAKNMKGYTDVDGHYAEEAILALDAVGAHLGTTEFLPDAVITQADFVTLVSDCVMGYYPLMDGQGVDVARIYSHVVRNGVLSKDEEAPDAPLKREQAVAYLLRAMGYGAFAEIEGIFKCDFRDADKVAFPFYGYVAIAKGLGIINGDENGNFVPDREVTRGEAAVMIYNYLK